MSFEIIYLSVICLTAGSLIVFAFLKPKKDKDPNLAKTKLRLFNGLIDLAVFMVIWIVVGGVIAYFLVKTLHLMPWHAQTLQLLTGPILLVLYFVLMEYFTQKTVGKMITKTKVISSSGGRAGLIQIFVRTICRVIPFEYFTFIGSLEELHDRFSGTKVVTNEKLSNNLDFEQEV